MKPPAPSRISTSFRLRRETSSVSRLQGLLMPMSPVAVDPVTPEVRHDQEARPDEVSNAAAVLGTDPPQWASGGRFLNVNETPPRSGMTHCREQSNALRSVLALGALLALLSVLIVPSMGCTDAAAKQEDARILAEFRGPQFIPADQRRSHPMAPPLVPHVVYATDFRCLVCHGNEDFRFRGQRVKLCPHPERTACVQCHVPLQTKDEPFRFEVLGAGDHAAASARGGSQP